MAEGKTNHELLTALNHYIAVDVYNDSAWMVCFFLLGQNDNPSSTPSTKQVRAKENHTHKTIHNNQGDSRNHMQQTNKITKSRCNS
jgi:hypothetical protein